MVLKSRRQFRFHTQCVSRVGVVNIQISVIDAPRRFDGAIYIRIYFIHTYKMCRLQVMFTFDEQTGLVWVCAAVGSHVPFYEDFTIKFLTFSMLTACASAVAVA